MRLRACALLPLAALVSACPGSIDDPSRFSDATVLDATVAPDSTVAPDALSCPEYVERTLLPMTCATAYCHAATGPAAGLDLASPGVAQRVVGVRGSTSCRGVFLVDQARPEMSLMVTKLRSSPSCGGRMPLGRAALTAEQIECVRAWAAGLVGGDP